MLILTAARGPRSRAVLLYLALWAAYAALFAAQQAATLRAYDAPVRFERLLVESGSEAALWAVLAPLLGVALGGRSPSARPLRRSVVPVLAVALAVVALELVGWTAITHLFPWKKHAPTFAGDLARTAGESFAYVILIVAALVSAYAARALLRESRARALHAARLEAETGRARLASLTAQLQPHFLFNALSAIGGAVHEDPGRAERLLVALGDLLRSSLDLRHTPVIGLGDELALLGRYLAIQRARFGDRLTVRGPDPALLVADGLDDALVPQYVLQPLVENSIRHGLERHAAPLDVAITAARAGAMLLLTVTDDGPGFDGAGDLHVLADDPDTRAPRSGPGGVGLPNLAARLQLLYGNSGRLTCRNRHDGGARVTVQLPLRRRAQRIP